MRRRTDSPSSSSARAVTSDLGLRRPGWDSGSWCPQIPFRRPNVGTYAPVCNPYANGGQGSSRSKGFPETATTRGSVPGRKPRAERIPVPRFEASRPSSVEEKLLPGPRIRQGPRRTFPSAVCPRPCQSGRGSAKPWLKSDHLRGECTDRARVLRGLRALPRPRWGLGQTRLGTGFAHSWAAATEKADGPFRQALRDITPRTTQHRPSGRIPGGRF